MDFFDEAYQGRPPWDIGRPQKEFVGLVGKGEINGPILDIGCGTGELALFFAGEGFEVWGVDSSPHAIEKARGKAGERRLRVQFFVLNALELSGLDKKFSTTTDSGFFHTLSDPDRTIFVEELCGVLIPGGRYFMLCFSELEPEGYGPRRITKKEIQECFNNGWRIDYIRPAVFESRSRPEGTHAWLSSITKL